MTPESKAKRIAHNLDLQLLVDQANEAGDACYSVGRRPELDAGLYGFTASPTFDTKAELSAWILANKDSLEKEYGDDA